MQKFISFILSVMIAGMITSSCEPEEDSSSPSTGQQTIIGNWAGVSEQGFPVQLKVETRHDTLFITNYDFTYVADSDTHSLYKNDPQGHGYISADTFNFYLIHDSQKKGKTIGRFWSTNYMTGLLEVNEIKNIYHFNYSASKIGYSVSIHSAPQYSLILEDSQLAEYTYVKSFFASHDTLHRQDQVILSSEIYYEPTASGLKNTLLEIRLGSLPEGYTADQLRQLIITGFKTYSIGAEDGVEIIYRDKSNNYKAWSTSFGSASQESSLFNISELLPLSGTDTTYHLYKFTANFNCMLYDAEGNSKKVVNAMYLGLIGAGLGDN